jgi:nitrite reductase (NO-forming)
MFGIVLVEPAEGIPGVDDVFCFGQHELYTDKPTGQEGHHAFDLRRDGTREPDVRAAQRREVRVRGCQPWPALGERRRDGPDVHRDRRADPRVELPPHRERPVGLLPQRVTLDRVAHRHPDAGRPLGELYGRHDGVPGPERVEFVDHALSRVVRTGLLAHPDVTGEKRTDVFDPEVAGPGEGPTYGDG